MKDSTPRAIYLKDYKAPNFTITHTDLKFTLDDVATRVESDLKIEVTAEGQKTKAKELFLHGEELELIEVKLDGRILSRTEYIIGPDYINITNVPHKFTLSVTNIINPSANKALEGLYKSGNVFCTQNEPEGFRRITYFLDRSDVMSKFTTTIIADKKKFPILLSNGNETGRGIVDSNPSLHWVKWEDPFPKPSYLFALVAGDLGLVQDSFKTCSGRKIDLRIYCDKGNEDRCPHAMESLKKAMKWDEDVFGLEYDLDIYMIVAVDAFNMGAMENKGLNIFNTSCVLAKSETATDDDFRKIEGVVAHEYFHNWTGNRVTCRDWFQLTLKEGLTVFRDQEFSGDMNSKSVQRISDVRLLRAIQFAEDAGPMAHPIRPDSYIEINNFYTSTVYNKGAEVIRMIHTLLGPEGFRRGMNKYFELYDGQAVTTEDFLNAMEIAWGEKLTQFKNWYSQAGTPQIKATYEYDEKNSKLLVHWEQSCPPTPGSTEKDPYYLPIELGVIGPDGNSVEVEFTCPESNKANTKDSYSKILILTKEKQTLELSNVPKGSVLSVNRNFTAPVNLEVNYTLKDYMFLMAYDKDDFSRWEASQQLAAELIGSFMNGKMDHLPSDYLNSYATLLKDESIDPAFKALALALPAESYLTGKFSPIDFDNIHLSRVKMLEQISSKHQDSFYDLYRNLEQSSVATSIDPIDMGRRDLKNICLSFLNLNEVQEMTELAWKQFKNAKNMSDEWSALAALSQTRSERYNEALSEFFNKWKNDPLVLNKWFSIQAMRRFPDTLENVKKLSEHSLFRLDNPNSLRSLLVVFARNLVHFHQKSGQGYEFIADKLIEVDRLNPQMGSHLASSFNQYGKCDENRKKLMRKQLERVLSTKNLSKNAYEIISKNLNYSA